MVEIEIINDVFQVENEKLWKDIMVLIEVKCGVELMIFEVERQIKKFREFVDREKIDREVM